MNLNKYLILFLFAFLVFKNQISFALLEFPDFNQNKNTSQNNFLQDLITKINFGNSMQNQNLNTNQNIPIQTIQNQNTNPQIPNIDLPKVEITDFSAPFKNTNYFSESKTSAEPIAPSINLIKENNVKLELEKKVCDALIKKGIVFKENTPCVGGKIETKEVATKNSNPQNNSTIPAQQEKQIANNLQNVYGQNPYNPVQNWSGNDYGFSACQFSQNKSSCQRDLEIACANAYEEGSYFTPECASISKNAYSGSRFASKPYYGMQQFLDDKRTENMQSFLQGDKSYGNTGVLGGENYSNFSGSDFAISGVATQYGCMNNKPDNFLISTYKYITAFGQKARYGTNVGDSTNSCNFNYCGVAVSLPFINKVYGSKNNAKNQPVKIVNKANLKCVIAPIQDISSVKSWTHQGSNAITDLSQCAMQAIGGGGKSYVLLSPVKKGESTEGCTVLK